MLCQVRHGWYLFIEKLLRWSINPRLRAHLLRFFGAKIGRNARIYEVRFFNLSNGFRNLYVGDDVHIGVDSLIDLEGPLHIGNRSTISPRVTVLTHQDPGSHHNTKMLKFFPAYVKETLIGDDCWIGSNVVVLSGVRIGDCVAIGAGSVVNHNLSDGILAAGSPVKKVRDLGL